ncbi:MAG: hypothetical protein Q8T08_07370, partial [Ignavibacteria bacterium]|nr:hypothetical protein [Ignavibacteria bacterium]
MTEEIVTENEVSIVLVCRVLDVHRPGYYYKRKRDDCEVIDAISKKVEHLKDGFRKIYCRLRNKGYQWNHKRVYRVYKLMNLKYRRRLKRSNSGNISEMQWQHGAGNNNAYAFVYDNLSRLTTTTRYSNGTSLTSFTERDITYDRNGNITSLKRYGSNGNTPDDNFTYNYDGNRITSITGSVSATYTYDSNGNLAGDGRKNLQMQYNLINLPQTVNQGSVSKARYIWLSDGTKASVVADTLSNNGYTYLG